MINNSHGDRFTFKKPILIQNKTKKTKKGQKTSNKNTHCKSKDTFIDVMVCTSMINGSLTYTFTSDRHLCEDNSLRSPPVRPQNINLWLRKVIFIICADFLVCIQILVDWVQVSITPKGDNFFIPRFEVGTIMWDVLERQVTNCLQLIEGIGSESPFLLISLSQRLSELHYIYEHRPSGSFVERILSPRQVISWTLI